jgi:hypothetical protein
MYEGGNHEASDLYKIDIFALSISDFLEFCFTETNRSAGFPFWSLGATNVWNGQETRFIHYCVG